MSDLKENERRRQERAELVNAFTRTAWQPSSRPQVGPRVLAGGAALIVVAGAAFGLGAMVSYRHKQDASEHTRQLALAAQNGHATTSLQSPGSASGGITTTGGAPSLGPSTPGNPGGQPVVPGRSTPGTKGTATPPPVTGGQRPPASPRPEGGVNAAAAGGTAHGHKKAHATRSSSPRRMTLAEVAAQQGGETAPYLPPMPQVSPTASLPPTPAPSPTRRFVRSVRPAKSSKPGSSGKTPARGGRDAYSTIQAESFARRSKHLSTEDSKDVGGGRNIASAASGDWALYKRIDFGSTGARQFYARIATDKADGYGRVEVRLDSPGSAPIATLYNINTGGWQNWSTVSVGASGVTGVHDVYFTFKSDQIWDFININWFRFGR